jgi:hypothetical protein
MIFLSCKITRPTTPERHATIPEWVSSEESLSTVVPGTDERFPLYSDTNMTELNNIRTAFENARKIKTLEDRTLSMNHRLTLAKDLLDQDRPQRMNIFAGGLNTDFPLSEYKERKENRDIIQ